MGIPTLVCMGLVLLLIAYVGFGNLKRSDEDSFFNKEESNALRGFWCLVIVLVHVPSAYQNPLQNVVGSFAYVGVTFFFMTSAYGLQLSLRNHGIKALNGFWARRLPKLLIPCLLVNALGLFERFLAGDSVSWLRLIRIDNWVIWLMFCYFAFWGVNRFLKTSRMASDVSVSLIVVALSLASYFIGDASPIYHWPTEIWGFIWGIALARHRDTFKRIVLDKSLVSFLSAFAVSVVLGILYLKFKTVVFIGDYVIKITLGLALIILMLVLDVIYKVSGRLNSYLGAISYEVYLAHGIVFSLISIVAAGLSSGAFIVASLVATIVVASMIHWLGQLLLDLIAMSFMASGKTSHR